MPDLAAAAGRAAALAFAALTRVTGSKPLHPHGVLFDAVLERTGPARPVGVEWLDATARDDVLVRLSRGAGLPARLPDLLGFALRVPGNPPVDLLLSTSGTGPLTRQVPTLRRQATAAYGSVMSYRSAAGPLALAAFPQQRGVPATRQALLTGGAGLRFTLAVARGRGEWQPFGTVVLRAPAEPADPDLHFDAMRCPPPGLATSGALARFRRPAYAAARAVHDTRTGVLRAAEEA